ncbi:hypothetical protein Bbelb_156760 [Branchiostoma belcheri]|nr:hypothetical protein Bbelb_156760 [Branchiostoma belcheri]
MSGSRRTYRTLPLDVPHSPAERIALSRRTSRTLPREVPHSVLHSPAERPSKIDAYFVACAESQRKKQSARGGRPSHWAPFGDGIPGDKAAVTADCQGEGNVQFSSLICHPPSGMTTDIFAHFRHDDHCQKATKFLHKIRDVLRESAGRCAGLPSGECGTSSGRVRYVLRESAVRPAGECGTFCGSQTFCSSLLEQRKLEVNDLRPACKQDWTGSGCNIKGAGGFC